MYGKLFAESGLSLDRLRVLVDVAASGSIVRASGGDPVRQSQYSRQLKELEDFFQTRLLERHGKGARLTAPGRELARMSRFFLMGLSNFQRGCLAERQTFRIGASATVVLHLLLPVLADPKTVGQGPRVEIETVEPEAIERRLHDLTLDFGITTATLPSRPLKAQELGVWRLRWWVPRRRFRTGRAVRLALEAGELPWVLARELSRVDPTLLRRCPPQLTCDSFLEAQAAAEHGSLATLLPDFLRPEGDEGGFFGVDWRGDGHRPYGYGLVWNPRLMRLNVHAARTRETLSARLAARFASLARQSHT